MQKDKALCSFIVTAGVIWGIVAFAFGIVSSFTLNSIDLWQSVIGLVCGFLAILPISVAAIWRPKFAAIALGICIVVVEAVGLVQQGIEGVMQVTARIELPSILLLIGYLYIVRHNLDCGLRGGDSR